MPRDRTYIVAGTGDGPVLTNVANANYFAAGVDLRNGLMYATEPLFWYNLFQDELIPWLAESYAYDDGFTGLTIKMRNGAAWSDGHPVHRARRWRSLTTCWWRMGAASATCVPPLCSPTG